MAFFAICYMYIDLFALQYIADRRGEYFQHRCIIITLHTEGDNAQNNHSFLVRTITLILTQPLERGSNPQLCQSRSPLSNALPTEQS